MANEDNDILNSQEGQVLNLANEYLDRCRAGENPSIAEYKSSHPELAEQISEVFPMMRLMEQNAPNLHAETPSSIGKLQDLKQLGEFRILREIGRGGMGVVYEAMQESLSRRVALKVCPFTDALHPSYVARFERESRAAAMMHHTNIVPVFAVGKQGDHQYYAMQFIEGAPLNDVILELAKVCGLRGAQRKPLNEAVAIDSHRSQSIQEVSQSLLQGLPALAEDLDEQVSESSRSGDLSKVSLPGQSSSVTAGKQDSSPCSTREYFQSIARIGKQVCSALEYSHSFGTFHRDIKPSNLMLDYYGTVWVTDFGLVKSESEEDLTEAGELLGTLRYMPPEQTEGNFGPRGDIYSLGLTLYELTTLRPAFPQESRNELVVALQESTPQRPRELNPRVPLDLETIILKAIDREPDRRYLTAQEFGADLNRFLDGKPIHARRISPFVRFTKWVKRYPIVAALSASLLMAVCVGAAGVVSQWLRAEESARRAQQEARTIERIAGMIVGVVQSQDLLAFDGEGFYRNAGRKLTHNDNSELAAVVQEVERHLQDRPEMQAELLNSIGQVYLSRGELSEYGRLIEKAYAIREKQLGEFHADTILSRASVGQLRLITGYYEEAIALLNSALKTQMQAGRPEDELARTKLLLAWTYLDAQRELPVAVELTRQVADSDEAKPRQQVTALLIQAAANRLIGNRVDLLSSLLRAEVLSAKHEISEEIQGLLTNTLTAMAIWGGSTTDSKIQPLLDADRKLKEFLGASHPGSIYMSASLAKHLEESREFERAENFYREAADIAQRAFGACPRTERMIDELSQFYQRLSDVFRFQARWQDARSALREAIREYERVDWNRHTVSRSASLNTHALLKQKLSLYDAFLLDQAGKSGNAAQVIRDWSSTFGPRTSTQDERYQVSVSIVRLGVRTPVHGSDAEVIDRYRTRVQLGLDDQLLSHESYQVGQKPNADQHPTMTYSINKPAGELPLVVPGDYLRLYSQVREVSEVQHKANDVTSPTSFPGAAKENSLGNGMTLLRIPQLEPDEHSIQITNSNGEPTIEMRSCWVRLSVKVSRVR